MRRNKFLINISSGSHAQGHIRSRLQPPFFKLSAQRTTPAARPTSPATRLTSPTFVPTRRTSPLVIDVAEAAAKLADTPAAEVIAAVFQGSVRG
jgi:hypothetical protein